MVRKDEKTKEGKSFCSFGKLKEIKKMVRYQEKYLSVMVYFVSLQISSLLVRNHDCFFTLVSLSYNPKGPIIF